MSGGAVCGKIAGLGVAWWGYRLYCGNAWKTVGKSGVPLWKRHSMGSSTYFTHVSRVDLCQNKNAKQKRL